MITETITFKFDTEEQQRRFHDHLTNKPLDPCNERDRLEIASQLYERFCADLVQQSDKARVRLISGIQVALRDAAAGEMTPPPHPKSQQQG